MALPHDYAERVYAGLLGKIIGVYLGRPFEGWTYERIMADLSRVEHPLDVALSEFGRSPFMRERTMPKISPEAPEPKVEMSDAEKNRLAAVEALKRGLIKDRDELFITTKLWCASPDRAAELRANVSAQVLNGTMTPDAAAAQLEDGLKKWYAPHRK